MTERIDRDELVRQVIERTGIDDRSVSEIVDAFLDEIYQAIKQEQSVTIKNFGGFYVRPEQDSWVFKFYPCQKWRALFGWSSTYREEL
jgi:DNA-binding protein HU-beta